jgi:cell wall-associated NlpC family hydrolase
MISIALILILKELKPAEKNQRKRSMAFMYLNAPWGGKTPFGIDCSGFTQMVYKLNGFHLLRDSLSNQHKEKPKLY